MHYAVPRVLLLTMAAALLVPAAFPRASAAARSEIVAADALEPVVLRDLNTVRRQHGLVPLRLAATLSAAADRHSREMALGGYFTHESRDGTSFGQRLRQFYPSRGFGTWSVGENLVWASPQISADEALALWMKSPGHRDNVLNPVWREVGLGAVQASGAPGAFDGLDVTLLTADFGVRH
jgi:uncharacterized protein YkwD